MQAGRARLCLLRPAASALLDGRHRLFACRRTDRALPPGRQARAAVHACSHADGHPGCKVLCRQGQARRTAAPSAGSSTVMRSSRGSCWKMSLGLPTKVCDSVVPCVTLSGSSPDCATPCQRTQHLGRPCALAGLLTEPGFAHHQQAPACLWTLSWAAAGTRGRMQGLTEKGYRRASDRLRLLLQLPPVLLSCARCTPQRGDPVPGVGGAQLSSRLACAAVLCPMAWGHTGSILRCAHAAVQTETCCCQQVGVGSSCSACRAAQPTAACPACWTDCQRRQPQAAGCARRPAAGAPVCQRRRCCLCGPTGRARRPQRAPLRPVAAPGARPGRPPRRAPGSGPSLSCARSPPRQLSLSDVGGARAGEGLGFRV